VAGAGVAAAGAGGGGAVVALCDRAFEPILAAWRNEGIEGFGTHVRTRRVVT